MVQNRLWKYSEDKTDYEDTVGMKQTMEIQVSMKQTMENSIDETDRANRVWYFLGIQGKMNYYI